MLKKLVQLCFVFTGGALGFIFIPELISIINIEVPLWLTSPYIGAIIGAVIIFFSTFWLADYVVDLIKLLEDMIVRAPITDVFFGAMGLIIGLIVAYLIGIPMSSINVPIVSTVVPFFVTILFGYLGFRIGFKKRDEIIALITLTKGLGKKKEEESLPTEVSGKQLKILDTSVIIDGRIADICKTGFLEGTLVIPQFVLEELQHIADSSDVLKRNRGRRGLDILNKIQKEMPIAVEIYEGDFEDIAEVDSKLIKLAKMSSGVVVTNDYNLNKVCELQGVSVLNINDLANAVKPVVLPGEELNVQVIKDGKEQNQGVAYLDDGTMIVVEDGRSYIGREVDVVVTSVLQTSAGRMIFAKPKLLEKAL